MKNTVLFIITMMLAAVQSLSAQNASATGADTVYAANSVLSSGSWAKIRVSTTGIHQLTSDVIRQAGFSDLSKVKVYGYGGNIVPDKLTASYLKEHDDLHEVATCTVNGVKYFYADGPVNWSSTDKENEKRTRNYFSNYGYYFITQNDNAGLTCSEQDLYDKVTASPFAHHFIHETDDYAWAETGRNLVESTKITTSSPMTINVVVPKGNTQATFIVGLTAAPLDTAKYSVTCGSSFANGTIRMVDSYSKCNISYANFTVSNLTESEDGSIICPVTIKPKSANAEIRLDYLQAWFATPATPAALSSGTYPVAEYACNITNQNHHADSPTDLIIIIPTSQHLLSQAKELANFHAEHDGITTTIVPADELYNEFSSGTPDFSAYRRYLKMFYDRNQTNGSKMPQNVLLFGDAVWDNRMLTLSSAYNVDNYLLCHETENSYNTQYSFSSDDYITILHDEQAISETSSNRNLSFDIGVGRIPVTTIAQARIVVDKIEDYVTNDNIGPWQNNILFFADDSDNNSHMRNINIVADSVIQERPGYNVKKALSDAYVLESTSTGDRYPVLASLVKKMQKNGSLVINYGGHSSWTQLADEMIVTLADVKSYKGENLSLWFTAGCETVPFDQQAETIGEQILLNKNGGAVAFYGTTRTVDENKNATMDKAFMRYVLSYDDDGKPLTLGEAQRRAKNSMITNVNHDGTELTANKHQYVLIGDPAMSLAIPRYEAVVDKINDVATTDVDTVKGNSLVTVTGHIIDRKNAAVTNFSGIASILVRDSRREFKCRDNRGEGTALSYKDRTNILYNGTCAVTNGQFTCTFRMPSDIYNDGGTGLINVFAYDSKQKLSANGACGQLCAKGWDEAENDSVGPSIYAYFNNSSFQNGGNVSQTPFFIAEVSDNDGLSTTGMALGHNMELVVDGSASMTYDLNDNFSYDLGSYTSGQTYYTLPTMSLGQHTLEFTAWDILGNPSKTSLSFNVVKGLSPEVTHVSVAPNPITDKAIFYVTHDQLGSEAEINIDILDLMGRVVQTLTWNDTFSETNTTSKYKWEPSGISRGMYLYRVRVSCNGSKDTTASQKLILAQ